MCGTCDARTTPIPSQRAHASSVGKTPSFSFCQVDMYATGESFGCFLPFVLDITKLLGQIEIRKGPTVDTNSLRHLPRQPSQNCGLQFANNDKENCIDDDTCPHFMITEFHDHIGNKCTLPSLVCFNVSSLDLVRLHACSLLVCHVFL